MNTIKQAYMKALREYYPRKIAEELRSVQPMDNVRFDPEALAKEAQWYFGDRSNCVHRNPPNESQKKTSKT